MEMAASKRNADGYVPRHPVVITEQRVRDRNLLAARPSLCFEAMFQVPCARPVHGHQVKAANNA